MKHAEILTRLVADARADPSIVGFLVFGSVARGTHREDSDIDVLTVLAADDVAAGIRNRVTDGIKVGNLFFSRAVLVHSVETVPYLLHPLGEATLLVDRDGTVEPLLAHIRGYFVQHPEIVAEWQAFYDQLQAEKARYGHEKTTIVDVWNELEASHSGGRIRRQFFNAFYLTSPRIFAIVKRFM
ncbi:MAG: nucleotidyltransferase domain-containing protein [Chloroflexota bacterium]|nr:nucleotidyltransferase domain-containing protein [Chloroflexota bacterium]MDH5242926.1 nucleotidyltransferase domain-containing protein [Chloroflexota bacterium]